MVRSTLGPRGMDKLIHDDKGNVTISNDGATIMKLLDIVHPAAKILVDIAKSQDSEVFSLSLLFGFKSQISILLRTITVIFARIDDFALSYKIFLIFFFTVVLV